jgi:hypothetical protein
VIATRCVHAKDIMCTKHQAITFLTSAYNQINDPDVACRIIFMQVKENTMVNRITLKWSRIGFVLSTLLVTTLIVSPVGGQTDASAGITIPYSGQLTGDNGEPVADDLYDFTFAIYDVAEGGNLVWSEAQAGVSVQGGVFTVILGSVNPVPDSMSEEGWLEVNVRGPQDKAAATLFPRQQLSAVSPSSLSGKTAGSTCAHDHLEESWSGSATNYGLRVYNTSGNDGLRGVANTTSYTYAGVSGYNNGAGGPAMYATSSGGDGINATSSATGWSGVYGHATNGYGVTGESTNRYGIQAKGNDASGTDAYGDIWLDGARGEIVTGERLNLSSNWNVNVMLDRDANDTSGVFNIYANNSTSAVLYVSQTGNLWVGGTFTAIGAKSALVQTDDYGQRLLYAMESPEVWFEDLGTGVLANGVVTVTIEAMFAETVDLSDYHVLVTPICEEPAVLYVTSKTPTDFTVKGVTLDGQPSSCSFDYRISAKRLGYEDVRMEAPEATERSDVPTR